MMILRMSKKYRSHYLLLIVFIVVLFVPITPINSNVGIKPQKSASPSLTPIQAAPVKTKSVFAFVSNFESLTLEGWRSVLGKSPSVVTSPNYSGEPSLMSKSSTVAQVDYANKGFVTGLSFLSFQVAIHAASKSSQGYFGLASGSSTDPQPLAVVGIVDGNIV